MGHSKGPFWIEGEREREREKEKEKERRLKPRHASTVAVSCGSENQTARKSQFCSTTVVKETCPRGPPNGAGFEYGQENIYFRIGLVLALLKVVFPDLGLPKQIFIIRETFINRGNGLLRFCASIS